MIYHNNILCVSREELAKFYADRTITSWGLKIVKKGKGQGNYTLYDFYSIPNNRQKELESKLESKPELIAAANSYYEKTEHDYVARDFYNGYQLPDGRFLADLKNGAEVIEEYCRNAAVLNAIAKQWEDTVNMRARFGKKPVNFWQDASRAINSFRDDKIKGHTLPAGDIPLKRKFEAYKGKKATKDGRIGYAVLVSGNRSNENARKVNCDIENLLLSLYRMDNKPFCSGVHELYTMFIKGLIEVADKKTGELFNPADFKDKKGNPIELSEATVWRYINMPKNRPVVDKVRSGAFHFNNEHRPYHHRHSPFFTFSKCSLDDRDLPRKCVNGKRVKAYYAYDVTSGCVVGNSYSFDKDEDLFIDCIQSMLRFINKEGFGMPMQVEVEHHLVSKYFDDLASMFSFMRICNPGNSQEKRAEHLNKAKKYGTEKLTQNGIGRWWAKSEAYRVDNDKVNDEFVEKKYSYEQLVADDMKACADYNNQLHPKQKLYPKMTRWDVLKENLNPDLLPLNKSIAYKCFGDHTITTIVRNQGVRVQYNKYQLPNPNVLDKLQPNNYTVDAYYLPNAEGLIDEVYLYQNGVFICKCAKIVTYNEANAEWTDADKDSYTEQAKYVAQFDAAIKQGVSQLSKPVIIKKEALALPSSEAFENEAQPAPVLKTETTEINDLNEKELVSMALDNL